MNSSLLDLQYTSSHAYDFEILLKGFRLSVVDLVAAIRFHQHLIVGLVPVDTLMELEGYRTSHISQE